MNINKQYVTSKKHAIIFRTYTTIYSNSQNYDHHNEWPLNLYI
jgi:hypothetical protein